MNNLPETLKVGKLSSVQAMEIESLRLDPIVKSKEFTRFVIPSIGILDSDSMIQFSVHNTDVAGDGKCFLPVSVGAHACIKSAVMKINGRVICRSDDHGYFSSIQRVFRPQEIRERIDLVELGTCDVYQPSNQGNGTMEMRACTYSGGNALPSDKFGRQTSSRSNCPLYGVRLSDIFLFMKSRMLPLFAMQGDELTLEITWQTQSNSQEGNLLIFEQGYGGDKSAEVGIENQLFLSDHLLYDDNRQAEILQAMNKDSGLSFPYEDIILIKSQTPALNPAPGAGVVQNQVLNTQLGLSGKNVRSIFVHDKRTDSNSNFHGAYASYAPNCPTSENWTINDAQHYQRDIVSETRRLTELASCAGRVPDLPAAVYSLDTVTDKADLTRQPVQTSMTSEGFYGHTQTELEGSQHYSGLDLSVSDLNIPGSGTLVKSKPIEHKRVFFRTTGGTGNPPFDTRYFCIIEKLFNLKSGLVSVV